MNRLFLLFLIMAFFCDAGIAEETLSNKKDSIHKYLIAMKTSDLATLYKEHDLVVVRDNYGIRYRGRLHVLGDNTFMIENDFTGEKDTLGLDELYKIKRVSYATDIIGIILIAGATPLIYSGVVLLSAGYGLLDAILGTMAVTSGISMAGYGALFKSGFNKRNSTYNVFALATTKGFRLTNKNAKAYALERYPELKNQKVRTRL